MNREIFYVIVVSQKYKHTGFICVTKKHLFKLHCYFKRGLLWNTVMCGWECGGVYLPLLMTHFDEQHLQRHGALLVLAVLRLI